MQTGQMKSGAVMQPTIIQTSMGGAFGISSMIIACGLFKITKIMTGKPGTTGKGQLIFVSSVVQLWNHYGTHTTKRRRRRKFTTGTTTILITGTTMSITQHRLQRPTTTNTGMHTGMNMRKIENHTMATTTVRMTGPMARMTGATTTITIMTTLI